MLDSIAFITSQRRMRDQFATPGDIRHMKDDQWRPGLDPIAEATCHSPSSAILTATSGCCRRSQACLTAAVPTERPGSEIRVRAGRTNPTYLVRDALTIRRSSRTPEPHPRPHGSMANPAGGTKPAGGGSCRASTNFWQRSNLVGVPAQAYFGGAPLGHSAGRNLHRVRKDEPPSV